MKIFSSDYWYEKLDKSIKLAEAFTQAEGLSFIIKACRLKPYDVIYGDSKFNVKLHKHWIDEHGNSLKIIKNKRIKITFNDLIQEKKNIVCTDFYYNLSIDKIIKMSKLLYVFSGKEDVLDSNCIYLCFLGIDNYLRCYLYLYDEWSQISPLYLGMNNLKLISKNHDIKYYLEISNSYKNYPTACHTGKSWLTSLPVSSKLADILEQNNTMFSNLLQKGKK